MNYIKRIFVIVILATGFQGNLIAKTLSDIFVILSDDGRTHTFKQTLETGQTAYQYPLPGTVAKDKLIFIDTKDNNYQRLDGTILSFPTGDFSLMFRNRFDKQIVQNSEGEFVYDNTAVSATGFSLPKGYDFFSFTWILPENMHITRYSSNIGTAIWQQSDNILRFKTEGQNNIQLKIFFKRNVQSLTQDSKVVEEKEVGKINNRKPDTKNKREKSSAPSTNTPQIQLCQKDSERDLIQQLLCESDNTITLENLKFDRNSASLSPQARSILDKLVSPLQTNANLIFEVSAYTDSRGPSKWNQALSEERAHTVRLYLIFKGVQASQLIAKGYGENNPIADNNTKQGQLLNRRLQLRLDVGSK